MKWISYIMLTAIIALGFAACGMGGQEPGSSTVGITNSPSDSTTNPVGMIECLGCHMDEFNPASLANVVGDSAGSSGWINGPHANNNITPPYYYFSSGSTCTTCHDQLGEGQTITDIESATGIDLGGSNRPIISCESCHGSGSDHFGTGTVEYTRPDAARCGQCHNETFDHEGHPTGDEIYEKYSASKHANSIIDHIYEDADLTLVKASCSKCHTDEGAQIYRDVDAGHDELVTIFENEPALDSTAMDVNAVQCRTCHNPHNPNEYLEDDTTDILGNVVASGQYNTCENCHQMADSYHGEKDNHSWASQNNTCDSCHQAHGPVGGGEFNPSSIIYDTHVDNPNTPDIEGYVVDVAADNACSGCHDVHEAETSSETPGEMSINEQWARSKHAGHILDKKDVGFANIVSSVPAEAIANLTALINGTDTTGSVLSAESSFAHYNFTDFAGGSCRRCHTSSGFKYMAETGSQPFGPASMIGFTNTADEREMVYCWACHQSIADDLRGDTYSKGHYTDNSLIFNSITPYSEPADRIDAIGDLGGSNVCMSCHSGRNSGETMKDSIIADPSLLTQDYSKQSSSHYLAAGGVLFNTIGYEDAAEDYTNPVGFSHGTIGTTEGVSWGDNGPCVACHMKYEEGHTMEAVEITGGLISNIPAYENTCSLCHGADKDGFITFMDTQKAGFEDALAELEAELNADSIYVGGYPYFFSDAGLTTPYAAWSNAQLMAAFNLNMLSHEPGAYAHNSLYTKRLIFDSIDWLDDGVINGSTTATGSALTYLNGGVRP